jgi:hypothetical protein
MEYLGHGIKSLLDCYQEQSPTPISFMSGGFLWVIKWVETRGDVTLTQRLGLVRKEQRRSGILTSASGLIKG